MTSLSFNQSEVYMCVEISVRYKEYPTSTAYCFQFRDVYLSPLSISTTKRNSINLFTSLFLPAMRFEFLTTLSTFFNLLSTILCGSQRRFITLPALAMYNLCYLCLLSSNHKEKLKTSSSAWLAKGTQLVLLIRAPPLLLQQDDYLISCHGTQVMSRIADCGQVSQDKMTKWLSKKTSGSNPLTPFLCLHCSSPFWVKVWVWIMKGLKGRDVRVVYFQRMVTNPIGLGRVPSVRITSIAWDTNKTYYGRYGINNSGMKDISWVRD